MSNLHAGQCPDEFSAMYADSLDGTYDCTDRIVLNAYFRLAMSPGGFRTWWRALHGGDDNLDQTHLMRYAGRFARRVKAYAGAHNIPLLRHEGKDDPRGRKHEVAAQHLPSDPEFRGVYCIICGKAPAPLWEVRTFASGAIDLRRKKPYSWPNHYSFYIIDPEWGRLLIKLCPHPPFGAQVILNGHEYVARQAHRQGLPFTKEENCFTDVSSAADLARIAEAMSAPGAEGRLVQVCERWIYTCCLCFALTLEEQRRCRFRYDYSVCQAEYSRNLLFQRGRVMEEVFNAVIDRTRAPLDITTLKTIFGYQRRPHHRRGKAPRFEAVVEKPVYNLTVFKIHFKRLTVKIYSKGERVLRIEVVAHNTKDLKGGRSIGCFAKIIRQLREIAERFLQVLGYVDRCFIDDATLESLPAHAVWNGKRISGIDVNDARMLAVMAALLALSTRPNGFLISELAAQVRRIMGWGEEEYRSHLAAYDLRKFRAKGLVQKVRSKRSYRICPEGLRGLAALIVLRQKVLKPLLAGAGKPTRGRKPKSYTEIDKHYEILQAQMRQLFKTLGIAA